MSRKQKWLAAFAAVALLVAAGLVAAVLAEDEPEAPASGPTPVPSPSPTADEPDDPSPAPTPEPDDPDEPVLTPAPEAPEPDRPHQEPSAQLVEPRPGMTDVSPIGWDDYEVLNERLVRAFFTSGVEPCYVLDRAEVQYQPDRVVITLFQGREPGSANVACIEIAVFKAVDVALDEPLGGRPIVDGSPQ